MYVLLYLMRSITTLPLLLPRKLNNSIAQNEVIMADTDTQIGKDCSLHLSSQAVYPASSPSLPSPLQMSWLPSRGKQ